MLFHLQHQQKRKHFARLEIQVLYNIRTFWGSCHLYSETTVSTVTRGNQPCGTLWDVCTLLLHSPRKHNQRCPRFDGQPSEKHRVSHAPTEHLDRGKGLRIHFLTLSILEPSSLGEKFPGSQGASAQAQGRGPGPKKPPALAPSRRLVAQVGYYIDEPSCKADDGRRWTLEAMDMSLCGAFCG